MLHSHVFRPLARHASLTAAVLATFAASALLHAWLVLAAGGFVLALSCAASLIRRFPADKQTTDGAHG